ncbi:MAG: transcriptional regulator [Halioglobus sp.]
MSNKISAPQIRCARAILGWSGKDLAERSGLGLATVRRAESDATSEKTNQSTINIIGLTLEKAGIEFTGDPRKNPGVILHIHGSS